MSLATAQSLEQAFELLVQSDELVAKALRVTEVAQIARAESRLREFLEAEWMVLQKKAIREAVKMGRKLVPASKISKRVIDILSKWPSQIEERYKKDVRRIYQKARAAAWKKARERSDILLTYDLPKFTKTVKKAKAKVTLDPRFDVVDDKAMDALEESLMLWLKEHMGQNISPSVREIVKQAMIEAGMSRTAAGKLLEERLNKELGIVRTPKGWHGGRRQYFEGLAANAATTARSHGHMRSFVDLGVLKVEVMNPLDERTCPVCKRMNGKVFTTDQGMRIVDRELKATTPEELKKAHPWKSFKELEKISKKDGPVGAKDAGALAAAGFVIPPYHFRCFVESTLVWTRRGLQQIESIQIGDEVLTHKLRWRRVTAVFANDYRGRMIQVGGISSTVDHPYLISRLNHVIFDAVVTGDQIARVKKDLDELRCMRQEISSDTLPYQNPPLMLGKMYEGKSSQSSAHQKEAENFWRTVDICQSKMRVLQEGSRANGVPSKAIPFLQSNMSQQISSSRRRDSVSRMQPNILADSGIETCGSKNLFSQMSPKEMGQVGLWPKERCQEGEICREEESNVWQVSRSRKMGYHRNSLAGHNPSSEFLGRSSRQHVPESGGGIHLRAEEVPTQRQLDLSSGFLSSEARCMDRSEGLDYQTCQRRNHKVVSASIDLDRARKIQTIEFVSFDPFIYSTETVRVWNLTVDEDESFIVGKLGLIVHNCRCVVSVSEEAGSFA